MGSIDELRWLPYLLVPSEPESGRDRPEIWQYRLTDGGSDWSHIDAWQVEQQWPIDVAFSNLAALALYWHTWSSREAAPARARTAGYDELVDWLNDTRNLAARLLLPGLDEAMQDVAARADRTRRVADQLFENAPTTLGTQADANFRCSTCLWAIDELARAINETEREWAALLGVPNAASLPTTQLWPSLFSPVDPMPAFADYREAKKRIRRLRVKPEKYGVLMRTALHAALTFGPFGPDGAHRAPIPAPPLK
jgi:hypothetical protein